MPELWTEHTQACRCLCMHRSLRLVSPVQEQDLDSNGSRDFLLSMHAPPLCLQCYAGLVVTSASIFVMYIDWLWRRRRLSLATIPIVVPGHICRELCRTERLRTPRKPLTLARKEKKVRIVTIG